MDKFAISNIAWQRFENKKIYALMTDIGITGLEVAPSKLFSNPYYVSEQTVYATRLEIERLGLMVVSMQSLLYGHPELTLFTDIDERNKLKLYLERAIVFATTLGAKCLVFGCPKNRFIGNNMDYATAEKIAIEFFREIGNYAAAHNVFVLLEANPKEYGADFIVNTHEAIDMIKKVDSKGFQLNLDLGTIILNNNAFDKVLKEAFPFIRHIHISEPYLAHVPQTPKLHKKFAEVISQYHYQHYISVEMRNASEFDNFSAIKKSLEFLIDVYS